MKVTAIFFLGFKRKDNINIYNNPSIKYKIGEEGFLSYHTWHEKEIHVQLLITDPTIDKGLLKDNSYFPPLHKDKS